MHPSFVLHGPMTTFVRRSWGTSGGGEGGGSATRASGLSIRYQSTPPPGGLLCWAMGSSGEKSDLGLAGLGGLPGGVKVKESIAQAQPCPSPDCLARLHMQLSFHLDSV